jgi:16S rRNA processing protein RimM
MRHRKLDLKHNNIQTGLPESGEPVFLAVGKIRKPHGIHGEIEMEILTDFPERLTPEKIIYIGEDHRPNKILSIRWKNALMLINLEGITTPEKAGLLRNEIVYGHSAELPKLPEGEYYYHEILGLKIIDANKKFVGTLIEILSTGANDVYVVQDKKGKEILLPAIKSVLINVDRELGEISVNMPQWLP